MFDSKKLAFIVIMLLALTACGGGGESKGSDVPDPSPPEVGQPVVQTQPVVIEPNGSNQIPSVLYDGALDSVAVGSQELSINRPDQEHAVIVVSEQDEVIWMGLAKTDTEPLLLGPNSSALVLVALFPTIATVYNNFPVETREIIINDPGYELLATLVGKTPYWSRMDNDLLTEALSHAIESVLTTIQERIKTGSFSTMRAAQLSPSGYARSIPDTASVESMVFYPTPEKYLEKKSGVTLTLLGSSSAEKADPKYKIEFSNDFTRTVRVLVGADANGLNEIDSFLLGSDNYWQPGKQTETREYSSSNVPKDGLGIEVIGPAFDTPSVKGRRAEYLVEAQAFTFIYDFAIPTISLLTGTNQCVKDVFAPTEYGLAFAKEVSTSVDMYALINGDAVDLVKTGLEISSMAIEHLADNVPSCISEALIKKTITYVNPVLGGYKVALDTASYVILDGGPFFKSLSDSSHVVNWNLKNEVEHDVYISVSPSKYLQPRWGSADYSTIEELTEEMRGSFSGECVADEHQSCDGFTFDLTGPYPVNYEVTCKDPITNDDVPCSKAVFKSGVGSEILEYPAQESGKVRFTYSYPGPKEYAGWLQAYDEWGAKSSFQFINLQLKEGQPQLLVYYNGKRLDYSVSNNTLKVRDPIKIGCCDSGASSETVDIVLRNEGRGSAATIDDYLVSDNSALQKSPSKNATIRAGNENSIKLSYSKSAEPVSGQLRIEGLLGGVNLDNDSALAETYSYNSIVIDVEGSELDCSKYDKLVVGKWTVQNVDPPGEVYDLEVYPDNTGEYVMPGGRKYPMSWKVARWDEILRTRYTVDSNVDRALGVEPGCIFFDKGFWHFAFDSMARSNLTDPLIGFEKYSLDGHYWPTDNHFGRDLSKESPTIIYRKQ